LGAGIKIILVEIDRRRPWTELLGGCWQTKHSRERNNGKKRGQKECHPNLKSVRHWFLLAFFLLLKHSDCAASRKKKAIP